MTPILLLKIAVALAFYFVFWACWDSSRDKARLWPPNKSLVLGMIALLCATIAGSLSPW